MKKGYKILIVVFIGLLALFFFPEPQTNFVYYVLTALFFVGIIWWMSKKLK
jgi:FtsH-binding integral membrane protein